MNDFCDNLGKLELLRAQLKTLKDFARDIRDNWDCDDDSHRYNTPCRACEAEKLLKTLGKE